MAAFLQVTLAGFVTGSLYGLLALGIVLIYRATGVLNFAYGAIGAIGVSVMYELIARGHFNFWLALLCALVFSFIFGFILERLFARPVLNAPVFTKAIATLALALTLQTIADQIWPELAQSVRFATPFDNVSARIGGVYIRLTDIIIIGTASVAMAVLTIFLTHSKIGIAMRAAAENMATARLMGAPVSMLIALTWSIGSLVAALAGIMEAANLNYVGVHMLDSALLYVFIGAVIGGIESMPGAVIGGVILGVVDNVLALYLAGHTWGPVNIGDPGVRESIIFAGFVILLFLRPQGLLGQRQLRRV